MAIHTIEVNGYTHLLR